MTGDEERKLDQRAIRLNKEKRMTDTPSDDQTGQSGLDEILLKLWKQATPDDAFHPDAIDESEELTEARTALENWGREQHLNGERQTFQALADSLELGGVRADETISITGLVKDLRAHVKIIDDELAELKGDIK